MKVALLQLKTLPTPEENLEKIKQMLVQAKQEGADLRFAKCAAAPMKTVPLCAYAMPENACVLQGIARNGRGPAYVVAGSVRFLRRMAESITPPSSMIIREAVARHLQTHLFDISAPGGRISWNPIPYRRRDITTFDTPGAGWELMICYDIRFPELSRICARRRKGNPAVPAAFNMTANLPLGNVLPHACLG